MRFPQFWRKGRTMSQQERSAFRQFDMAIYIDRGWEILANPLSLFPIGCACFRLLKGMLRVVVKVDARIQPVELLLAELRNRCAFSECDISAPIMGRFKWKGQSRYRAIASRAGIYH